LKNYFNWEVIINDPSVILQASEIEETHGISFWDALTISAAFSKNAATILTEDLNHGQVIEGIEISNPFKRC
jgi:predicted nucleic acid-binding protein